MRRIIFPLLILLSSLTFNACSVGKFIKSGYENFITYFNIYYNASRIFNEAEEELLKQQKDLFTTKVITPSGNITNKFVQVIEKCSKILQYHSNSAFVDDALFIIGKSYFYQKEYPSAIRKFTELITNFPESDYYLESKLWIARTYAQTIEVDRALRQLNDVYLEAGERKDRNVMSNALLEILKIYFKRNDNEGIINVGNEFVKISKNKNSIAQVYLLLGNAYAKSGELEKAIQNYLQVKKYTSDYYYRFKSQLELAKIFREQQKFSEAREILDNLSNESLYDEYKDFTLLEYAYLHLAQNDTLNALNFFIKIDTTYSSKETGAIAQFEIANYLENTLGNLDSAKYYYDKSLRAQLPDDLKKLAQFKSQLFNRYKNLWTSIRNFEKQIPLLRTFPVDSTYQKFQEIEIDSSMLSDSAYLADLQHYFEEKKRADSLYAIKLHQDSLRFQANLKTADSLEINVAKLKFDLATLFMIDFNKPDSAYIYLKEIVEKYPSQDFSERSFYALANYYETIGKKEIADSLFKVMYERFSDSEISKIVARRLGLQPKITQTNLPDFEYREAEELVKQKKYQEAIQKLFLIYDKHKNTDYAPKSLLMIGHIYENELRLSDSAYSVYKSLKEKYPASLFSQRINSKLLAYEGELQRKELEKKSKEDSLKQQKLNEEPKEIQKENPDLIKIDEPNIPDLKKEQKMIQDSSFKKEKLPDQIKRK